MLNKCEICNADIVVQSKSPRTDFVCRNGHEYHYSPYYREYHLGESNKDNTDTFGPSCCDGKNTINKDNKDIK